MAITNWVASASSQHFIYKTEAKRPWKPETVLELLEQSYKEFEKLMGPGLDIIIEVEDLICESNKLSARAEINKEIHSSQDSTIEVKFICEFPLNYGFTQEERDLAYHFFVHELFHCWIGGDVAPHCGSIVEAITQYMTNWVLVQLGWCPEDLLNRERKNCQQIVDNTSTPQATIAQYKLLFDKVHAEDSESLLAFCRDLANCFRQQRNQKEIDISPVLQQYLGTKSEEFRE